MGSCEEKGKRRGQSVKEDFRCKEKGSLFGGGRWRLGDWDYYSTIVGTFPAGGADDGALLVLIPVMVVLMYMV